MNREFERLTVPGLKNLARSRGIRGYLRLRRDQLINLLSNPGTSILDRDDNEDIRAPVLRPTIALPIIASVQVTTPRQQQAVEDLLESLEKVEEVPKSILPKLNALKKKIEKLYSKKKQIKAETHRSALKMWAEEHKIRGIPVSSPNEFLELLRPAMLEILRRKRNTKVKMVLQCLMFRLDDAENPVEANFSSDTNEINLEGTNANELYNIMISRILENYTNFVRTGSGWVFHSVVHLKLHTAIYEPLRGTGYIKLPDWIWNKKACINTKNYNNKCFLWCILRALNPKNKNAERIDSDL